MNIIYGAGNNGRILLECLESQGVVVDAFVVSDVSKKHTLKIKEKVVLSLDEVAEKISPPCVVYIAVEEKYWPEIEESIVKLKNLFDFIDVKWMGRDLILSLFRKMNPVDSNSFLMNINPVSSCFGLDRGMPIDRYYIEDFIQTYSKVLKKPKRIIEVAEDYYSKKFFSSNTAKYDVLDYSKGMDLTVYNSLPCNSYDLFICTQVFNFIYDVRKAIGGAYRLLEEGGCMLTTVAGNISQISEYDNERWGDYWRFTPKGIKGLVEEVFGKEIEIIPYGNAMSATAFIQGVAVEDVDKKLLDKKDESYTILIGIIAIKRLQKG